MPSESDQDFQEKIRRILNIDSQETIEKLLAEMDSNDLLDFIDAVVAGKEDIVKSIAEKHIDLPEEDEQDKEKADTYTDWKVGDMVKVGNDTGKVVQAFSNDTFAVMIDGQKQVVARNDVGKIDEDQSNPYIDMRRFAVLAGIMEDGDEADVEQHEVVDADNNGDTRAMISDLFDRIEKILPAITVEDLPNVRKRIDSLNDTICESVVSYRKTFPRKLKV